MNPLIVAKAASKAKDLATSDTGKKVLTYTGIGVGTLLGIVAVRKIIRNAKKKNSENRILDTEVQAAIRIRSAFNPSGSSWLKDMDGTNFTVIKEALQNIGSFKTLSKEYKNMYNTSILDDLKKELDQKELAEAFEIIKTK